MKTKGSTVQNVECPVCGRISGPESSHCSVSCALADRIPLGREGLPASWELVAFLLSGFILFNQFLLWCLGWLKIKEGEVALGDGILTASLILGIVWGISIVIAWVTHGPKRWGDYGIALGALLILVLPQIGSLLNLDAALRLLFANMLISKRLYRGTYCLWRASKKREK